MPGDERGFPNSAGKEGMMGPGLEVQTFERTKLLGRRWYFRIVDSGNWKTIATSEAYNSTAARDKTAKRFGVALGSSVVPERSKR
jgi:hypothetical protein